MDDYHRNNNEWMKPDTRDNHCIWFHLRDVQEQAKLISDDRNQNSGYFLAGGGGELWINVGIGYEPKQGTFQGNRNVLYPNLGSI